MSQNLRSMIAKGGKWFVSRRNFSSSPVPVSVESKRDFGKLIRVAVGSGCGLGVGFYGTELLRRKALRDNTFLLRGDEFLANADKYLIETVKGNSILKRKPKEGEFVISAKEFLENPADYLVNVAPK